MSKIKNKFKCEKCNYEIIKWMGKCPSCNEWNSFNEETDIDNKRDSYTCRSKSLADVTSLKERRYKSSSDEFDRVMGGGTVKGSITLLGGEPGVGKSTLLMELCKSYLKDRSIKILYVSGEESCSQVAQRAKRLQIESGNLLILTENKWQNVENELREIKPNFLMIDSIQTIKSVESNSNAGSVTQIKEVTHDIMNYCKKEEISCFIVGHVTKDGHIAGPKVLEHMVDTVISFEGGENSEYRMLKTIKNRFGSNNEIGLFEMSETGLKNIYNPAEYFINSNYEQSYGRSLTLETEGSRSLFVEIQSLVVENKLSQSIRTCQGYDTMRLHMLMAVVDKYLRIPLSLFDIYLNITGGMKIKSRDSDLSIIASLLSSHYKKNINYHSVFLGEVGLTGEVRSVANVKQRLKEIEKLNYKKVFLGQRQADEFNGKYNLKLVGIKKIEQLRTVIF